MARPKIPFNPEDAEYQTKPAFLRDAQRFMELCETRYGATRCGEGACKVQCGVSVEYQIIIGFFWSH